MTTLLDHRVTLAYLAHLGYPSPTTKALTLTKPRRSERKKKNKVNRTTYLIYVFGAVGSGKSSICGNLVRKRYSHDQENSRASLTVVNSVAYKGAEKYLVVSHSDRKFFFADLVFFLVFFLSVGEGL